MSDEQRVRWLRQLVQRSRPRMQIDPLCFVKLADAVVKLTNRQLRLGVFRLREEFGQRAVSGRTVFLPPGQEG